MSQITINRAVQIGRRLEDCYSERPAAPRNLGVIQGERLRRCTADESYSLTQTLLSLIAVAFAIIGTGMMLYGMMGG